MTLSEIKQALTDGGIRLTKSLGQNFMHDGNQLRRIASAAGLEPDDKVLEIGPGLGPLTEVILERTGRVLAIEMDRRLVDYLRERFSRVPGFELREGDALAIIRTERHDWSDWKLVSNLPYSVASPLLVELAIGPAAPRLITVTLQREVAERVAAAEGGETYGTLSLLIQLRYEPAGLFKIPATCFFPAPDVDSACVTLVRREVPLLDRAESAIFIKLVKRGFSQRRKMMFKLLRQDWPEAPLRAAFDALGLNVTARAETVSLARFVALTKDLVRSKNAG